jgi:hypothetical protein
MAGVSVRRRGTGDPEAPRLSQTPNVTRGIRGRRPAREKSCFELQKNRHRSPQSAVAGWQSWPRPVGPRWRHQASSGRLPPGGRHSAAQEESE